jgi:hypothetical protein
MKKKVGDIESSPELLDNIATSSRSKPSAKFVPGESLSVSMRKCFFNGLLLKQAPRKVKEKKRPETNRLSQTLLQASTASQWDAASSDFRLIFMVISFLFGICFCRLNGLWNYAAESINLTRSRLQKCYVALRTARWESASTVAIDLKEKFICVARRWQQDRRQSTGARNC